MSFAAEKNKASAPKKEHKSFFFHIGQCNAIDFRLDMTHEISLNFIIHVHCVLLQQGETASASVTTNTLPFYLLREASGWLLSPWLWCKTDLSFLYNADTLSLELCCRCCVRMIMADTDTATLWAIVLQSMQAMSHSLVSNDHHHSQTKLRLSHWLMVSVNKWPRDKCNFNPFKLTLKLSVGTISLYCVVRDSPIALLQHELVCWSQLKEWWEYSENLELCHLMSLLLSLNIIKNEAKKEYGLKSGHQGITDFGAANHHHSQL